MTDVTTYLPFPGLYSLSLVLICFFDRAKQIYVAFVFCSRKLELGVGHELDYALAT